MIEYAFRDDESPGQRALLLAALLLHALQNLFEALQVVVVVPPNGAARDLESLLDGKIDTTVRNDNVTALAESRDHRANGSERLGIDNRRLRAQEVSNVLLQLDVHICSGPLLLMTTLAC